MVTVADAEGVMSKARSDRVAGKQVVAAAE